MHYRKLGKWGVKVSEIALGSWLTYGVSVDEATAIKLIHHAFESGINFFDTANVYGLGQAEIVIGKAMQSLRRDACFLATKVFGSMADGPNDRGLSRKHVFEQCHASLKRLNTDYIDLYQCHRHDPDVPLEELIVTMDILTRQGKILYWGTSEWQAAEIQEACDVAYKLNAPPPVSNQPCYNMFRRDIEREVIPVSSRYGLGQVVYSPLAQGILTGKYKPGVAIPKDSRAASESDGVFMRNRGMLETDTLEKVQKLEKVAHEAGLTMSQLALAWCLRLNNVSSAIIGATKVGQIEENVKASGVVLSADIHSKIDEILSAELVAPTYINQS